MRKVKIFQLILATLSILGWAVAVYALLVFGEARPEREVGAFFNQGTSVRMYWDPHETQTLQYLIWICGAISLVSLAFNYYVAHHSKLGYWFNIPLLLLTSLVAGLYVHFVI
ncbi:hypothetical protein [Shewanella decolorationis]|uniref:Uncharacterized protein n=2 Tax=Shewanella decolorationis TaxID=256839 RepID=A0A5B8QZ04_9GAMM|nr:hypothetical protein [Shewanella decolorationis]ESE40299.1 membrane protein [Shewanella decolorationis S12]QDZ91196.1 hypothetical protein D0436_12365 [Shewanella decolorationis]GLR34525.1 hypothetical protein GCM10007922_40840 [Shewanella decolorationis]